MTTSELIKLLRQFPGDMDVLLQSRSDGEWGAFQVRSHVKSVVRRKVDDGAAIVIRAENEWHSSGGFA